MFDRKLLLGLWLAIAVALAPGALAQSEQTETGSYPAGQQGTTGSDQNQSSMTGQGDVDWTDARYSKSEVRMVQEALKSRGVYDGEVDGIRGPKTREALREFQRQNNLTVVGDINNDTLRALGIWEGALGGSSASGQASTGQSGTAGSQTMDRSGSEFGTGSTTGTQSDSSTTGTDTTGDQSSTSDRTGSIDPSTGTTGSDTTSQSGTDSTTQSDTTGTTGSDTTGWQSGTDSTQSDTTGTDSNTQSDTTSQSGTDSTDQSGTTGQTETGGWQNQGDQTGSTMDQSGTGDHSQLVSSATDVFRQVSTGNNVPSNIMQNARAIAIIPSGSSTMGAHGGMGAHGTMGTQGTTGTAGTQHSTGTAGTQDTTGMTGTQDATGTQGTTGTHGTMGAHGSMGMSAADSRGLVVRKNTDGTWSRTPAFIRMSHGSTQMGSTTGSGQMGTTTGSQTGTTGSTTDSTQMGSTTGQAGTWTSGDLVLVFSDDASLNALMDGSLDLGTEVTVQPGPSGSGAMGATGMMGTAGATGTQDTTGMTGTQDTTGMTGTQDTTGMTGTQDTMGQSGRGVVYAYSRSMGSFSGTSLTSGTIMIDESANQTAYGRSVSAQELLSGETGTQAQTASVFQPLIDVLSSQPPARAE